MHHRSIFSLLFTLALAAPASAGNLIPGTNCPAFRDNTYFHADISQLPKHPRSNAWMASMNSANTDLHPDFGPSFGDLPNACPTASRSPWSTAARPRSMSVPVRRRERPRPLSARAGHQVEGGQMSSGDRHTVIVDRTTCRLYETWATRRHGNRWRAGSGAVWDLNSNTLRPNGWTSADAAGLPILPLLLRYEEVAARAHRPRHPLHHRRHRPALSVAGAARGGHSQQPGRAADGRALPPQGEISRSASYRADTKAVLRAMKKYGLVLADNGSQLVLPGHRRPALDGQRHARRAEVDPGARLRGGRYVEPDDPPQQHAGAAAVAVGAARTLRAATS